MIKVSKEQSFFISAVFLLFFLLIFWLTLAPAQIGGPLTYAIVNGNSMEPGFFLGDLVLLRKEPAYGAGDAVVYLDPKMGKYVFHRIIAMEGDHFILQGDNNDWLDSHRPTQNEIHGKLWLHIPKVGKVVGWMREPLHAGISAGLLGVLLMFDQFKKTPQNKRDNRLPSIQLGAPSQLTLVGFGLLTLLFLALTIFSFTRPLDLPAETIPYQQTGDYYYSATGTPGVYDSDVVQTGEPVFPKLTCFLNVGVTYAIAGDRLQNVMGTQSMYARIRDEQSGWQRTIPLYPETPFSGQSNFTMATLNLCEVESIVNLVEAQAGLKQIAYTLEIVSDIKFTASVDGTVINDAFSPTLFFNYDKIHFFLAEDADANPLSTVKSGMVGSTSTRANSFNIFGFAFPVWLMRLLSLFGLVVCGAGMGVSGFGVYQNASQSQEEWIRLKYGSIIVNVQEQNLEPYSMAVDVNSIDDLARLADRHGVMILHMQRNFLHYYFIQSNGVTYRYVLSSGKKGMAAEDRTQEMPYPVTVTEIPAMPIEESIPQPVVEYVAEPAPVQAHIQVEEVKPVLPTQLEPVRSAPIQSVGKSWSTTRQPKVEEEAVTYILDTGEIEFYVPQREDAVMIKRVRL